ncbi:IclR family transcriptional regulator [Natronorubrum halophilum]|uniref:IclR family transcriptional regulator n=1 Tax=Natronorubrum halophilum TaxID=1702106 RepID=UPI000EF6BE06|nr:IclR family transcriptional regulator [Natronorubrum halophilum]
MGDKIQTRSKTTETSLEIVGTIREQEGTSIAELSEHVGLSESTVHRHLVSLQEYDYVVKDEDRYHIGFQFLTLGGYAQQRVTAYPVIKEKVDQLAENTGERAQCIVEENGQRVYLYTEVGESAVQTGAHIGRRGPLHVSAAGKAILANLPDERVDEIVDTHGFAGGTQNGISTRAELEETLRAVRDRGYGLNEQETTEGVNAIGAPIMDNSEEVIGALSVSGPASRLTEEHLVETVSEEVLSATNEVELYIAHSV